MKAPNPLPKDDEWKCGAGKRELCCRFLLLGPEGFECGRDHAGERLVNHLKYNCDHMSAKRMPEEPYPECQLK